MFGGGDAAAGEAVRCAIELAAMHNCLDSAEWPSGTFADRVLT